MSLLGDARARLAADRDARLSPMELQALRMAVVASEAGKGHPTPRAAVEAYRRAWWRHNYIGDPSSVVLAGVPTSGHPLPDAPVPCRVCAMQAGTRRRKKDIEDGWVTVP